ncbi:MAG: GDP-L-fucose synthase [Candidatus Omnitrophica bacterium]|nr:GDP-L-fucose synthase [Candidatus Omnitrophota bacterium]
MAKLLVTGAGGLIGYALKSLKLSEAVYLTRKDADLTDFAQTKEIFNKIKPDKVIHLAAQVGGIGGNMMHSGEYFRNNIMININVLEAARLCNVKKFISFMSTCVFPDACRYPLNEKDIHNGPPHPSNFGYAYAKRMLEVQSVAYRKEWGCDYIVAIPTNVYGPNDNFSLEDGHVVPSLIHKCYLAMKNKIDLILWGTGSPLREMVYSKDIAELALWALENYSEEAPIILSTGIETSIMDIAQIIIRKMGFKGKVVYDATKPEGQLRKPSDTIKLRKYLPEFKFTPIEKGIEETVKWFVSNYPNVRK